ncbi:MAG: DNA recombination protein RmuC [Candidatus Gygaella obscura]|nr:DNA recombination protein RmuC [Candidatus Gygaella obscura]
MNVWMAFIFFAVVFAVAIMVIFKLINSVTQRMNFLLQSIQNTTNSLNQNLANSTTIFGDVKEKLGRLEETNKKIYDVGKDISSLQELLRAPKFRGKFGEQFLENLLSQVVPKGYYQMQYKFKTNETVDAIIRLGEKIVPIDAKFTLENFQKKIEATTEDEANVFKKKFILDVKNRVDEISSKYILPDEDTYDFALMYIPAENVYYEVIITDNLLKSCLDKKVVPVSGNTLYAYLQVICLGLKGLKVEENAKKILKDLGSLSIGINKFKNDFSLLGNHLLNAGKKYDDSRVKLDKFCEKIDSVQNEKK